MEENALEDIIKATQSLNDLVMNTEPDLDEIVEDNNDEINLEVDYPYIIFYRSDLVRAMNLCNKIVQPKSNTTTYNSISLVPVPFDKCIWFYATNELSHFRYRAELLGDMKETWDFPISIPLTILQKLVKLMGNKVLLYKKEENLYIRLLDGDLLLDLRQADMTILTFPGDVSDKDKIAELKISNIGSVVNNILPLLQAEIRGEAKRISFTGDKAYYNSSFYYIETSIKTPRMTLSLRDADFINKLFKYYKNDEIQIFSVKSNLSRLFLKINNIEYEFINSINSISDIITRQMNNIVKEPEVMVSYDRLYRTVTLATTLPYSTGDVILKYNKDKLQTSIISNRGNSDFSFTTELLTENKLYDKEVLVRAETLRRLLTSFNEADKLSIALADLGITLEYKNIKAIMMHTNI